MRSARTDSRDSTIWQRRREQQRFTAVLPDLKSNLRIWKFDELDDLMFQALPRTGHVLRVFLFTSRLALLVLSVRLG